MVHLPSLVHDVVLLVIELSFHLLVVVSDLYLGLVLMQGWSDPWLWWNAGKFQWIRLFVGTVVSRLSLDDHGVHFAITSTMVLEPLLSVAWHSSLLVSNIHA